MGIPLSTVLVIPQGQAVHVHLIPCTLSILLFSLAPLLTRSSSHSQQQQGQVIMVELNLLFHTAQSYARGMLRRRWRRAMIDIVRLIRLI
ncbi:hypothetical protein ADUPG1_003984, partial [Aduncisulcus paluster]